MRGGTVTRLAPTIVALGIVVTGCARFPSPPPLQVSVPVPPPVLTQDVAPPVLISRVDLHDGMTAHTGSTYYFYGTEYGCGFQWQDASTPWCGFGVSTAPSLNGPWSAPTLLFSPSSSDASTGMTWDAECRFYGCYNARMVQRSDGVFLLYFNAPGDYARTGANAYYVMGCNGPAGPCGDAAGPPYGSTHKLALGICNGNGDFSFTVVAAASELWMFCTEADQTLASEKLDPWGTNGTNVGAKKVAALTSVEAPGVYYDHGPNAWVLTYSDPNCGFCGGTGTGHATAFDIRGPWTRRGSLSAHSCFGQPRDVDVIDGHVYEHIDQWYGLHNETFATTVLAPLAGMSCPASRLRPFPASTSTNSATISPPSPTTSPTIGTAPSPSAGSAPTGSTAPGGSR